MLQTEQTKNDPAFKVIEVNITTGETFVSIQKGIMGALANQLKNTTNRRKGANILRKLGHTFSACGDIQYGDAKVDDTDIDPNLITNEIEIEN